MTLTEQTNQDIDKFFGIKFDNPSPQAKQPLANLSP